MHHVARQAVDEPIASVGHDDVDLFADVFLDPSSFPRGDIEYIRTAGREAQGQFILLEELDGQPAFVNLLLAGHVGGQTSHGVDRFLDFPVVGHLRGRRAALGGGAGDGLAQLVDAAAARGHDAYHGAAQVLAQVLHVDAQAALLGQVHHVEGQHDGGLEFEQLDGEVKVPLQVRGVNDVDHDGRPLVEDVLPRDGFIDRQGAERVDTRQVHDANLGVAVAIGSFQAFDGHAGPVAHALPRTGQIVEERGFAAIGIAGNGDRVRRLAHTCFPAPSWRWTRMRSAMP